MIRKVQITLFLLFLISEFAQGSEITEKGRALSAFLDTRDVEHLWLSKHYVDWKSGKQDETREVTDGKSHTHCSAFAASTAMKLGIYILRPPDHSATLLANAQYEWLRDKGSEKGWMLVDSGARAQKDANEGLLVIAVYESPDPKKSGHIAIVRPSEKSAAKIQEEGPQIVQAGADNFVSASLKDGFRHHKGAFEKKEIAFYAHAIEDLKQTTK